MSNHDAVAALPSSGNPDKVLLRNLVTKRMPYVLADADDVTTLNAVDPATGAAIIDIVFLGRVFHYDSTDMTSVNDGVSVLVTLDGRRYKLSSSADVFAFSVNDATHAAPPGSPVLGDSYLVAAAATGAWVGKSNFVAVWTRRGWEFINFGIGRFLYNEATDGYLHKNAGGSWVSGLGTSTVPALSVPLSAAINFGKRLIVENQTTLAPPGSPVVGTAYIIGPSATGAWAGLDGRIAICEVAGSFVIYIATNGWAAYDKARNNEFHFTGSAWISSAGGIVVAPPPILSTSAGSRSGSPFYTYSDTAFPTRCTGVYDPATITYTANRAGSVGDENLIFDFQGQYFVQNITSSGVKDVTIALFRDAVAVAIDFQSVAEFMLTSTTDRKFIHACFRVPAVDTLSHVYQVAILDVNASVSVLSFGRRQFSVMERA